MVPRRVEMQTQPGANEYPSDVPGLRRLYAPGRLHTRQEVPRPGWSSLSSSPAGPARDRGSQVPPQLGLEVLAHYGQVPRQ